MPTAAGRCASRGGSSPTPRTRTAAVRSRLRLLQMPLRALDDGRPQRHRAGRPRPVDVRPAGLGVVRRSGQSPVADLEPDGDAVGAPILALDVTNTDAVIGALSIGAAAGISLSFQPSIHWS